MPKTNILNIPKGYGHSSIAFNSYRLINLYPELLSEEEGGTGLLNTPGLSVKDSFGIGPIRGSKVHAGVAYIVSGDTLYSYTIDRVITSIGTLNTSIGNVSISSNGVQGNQLLILDGRFGYIYNSSTEIFSVISDIDLTSSPSKCAFIDGYFIVTSSTHDNFQLSAYYDGISYSGGMVAKAERNPDGLSGVIVNNRQVYLVGKNSTEIWYNTGDDFPLSPMQNGFVEYGCSAPDSILSLKTAGVFWLMQTEDGYGSVIQTIGTRASNITPPELSSIWATYTNLEDASAWSYEEHGHKFYVITFPTANKTWCYDVSTERWHQRESLFGERFRADNHIFFNKEHLVGDYSNSNLYTMSPNTSTDDNKYVLREITLPHLSKFGNEIRHNDLRMEIETGTGNLEGQGSNPKISMSYSDDGGYLYSNVRTISLGAQGKYSSFVKWNMLGKSKNRVYKFTMADPIKYRIKKVFLDYTEAETASNVGSN